MRKIAGEINTKTTAGAVKLEAYDAEDMWQVYNLLSQGDIVTAPTIRKVKNESNAGVVQADRKFIKLAIRVQTVDFDVGADTIRLSGPVCQENPHVKMGAFHTLSLEPHRAFVLSKECWDSVYVDRLNYALDPASDAEVAAIMIEEGLAHVILLTRSLTLTKARVTHGVPRKGTKAVYNRDSAVKSFFDKVLRAALLHLNWDDLKVIIVASPGYVKDEFLEFADLAAAQRDLREFILNRGKLLPCTSSSGHKNALVELLGKPEVQSRLSETKAIRELTIFSKFMDMMRDDEDRAVYGHAHVKFAAEMGAVDSLLVTDKLFRCAKVEVRQEYIALVDTVKASNGEVAVFSIQHPTGMQLDKMSGLAAILRFPLAELDDIDPSAEL